MNERSYASFIHVAKGATSDRNHDLPPDRGCGCRLPTHATHNRFVAVGDCGCGWKLLLCMGDPKGVGDWSD